MSNLSKHFDLAELLVSEAAARNDIPMVPSNDIVQNLRALALNVLDPIREAAQVPIVVTSGWRPEKLNTLIGGSKTSDHLYGLAADIHAVGHDVGWLMVKIRGLQGIPLKQGIIEFNQWAHVSIDLGDVPKREFLVASRESGRTVYRTLGA